jgi:hypothetical protein
VELTRAELLPSTFVDISTVLAFPFGLAPSPEVTLNLFHTEVQWAAVALA